MNKSAMAKLILQFAVRKVMNKAGPRAFQGAVVGENIVNAGKQFIRSRMSKRIMWVEPLIKQDNPVFNFKETGAMRPVRMWCVCESKEHAVDVFMGPAESVDEKLYE